MDFEVLEVVEHFVLHNKKYIKLSKFNNKKLSP
jgi:hypothetical protein